MRVLICGITGSIGQQAIDVVKSEGYQLVGFTFHNNVKLAQKIIKEFPEALRYSNIHTKVNTVSNIDDLIKKSKPDIVLNAVVGIAGLNITLKTIEYNIDLALANKESIVIAGWLIKKLLLTSKTKIYPIDSEHSSIFDMLKNNRKEIKSIILTASGGPFFEKPISKLKSVSFKQAIKHPTWSMGYKISIDSATLMNKCFEMIEAFYLFETKEIDVVRHKRSIVHSIINFKDGTNWLNASTPDMKWSIQMGLSKYQSNNKIINDLNFHKLSLEFEKINENKWLPIKWAKEFIKTSNYVIPIVLNAANEIAIELFKNKKIKFLEIINLINNCIELYKDIKIANIKDIYFVDYIVKEYIRKEYS